MAYLRLFHGRRRLGTTGDGSPQYEELSDWGADGPVFGPFDHFHTTYATDIRFDGGALRIVDEMVYYGGLYYGDWSVFDDAVFADSESLRALHAEFDAAKADYVETPSDRPGIPVRQFQPSGAPDARPQQALPVAPQRRPDIRRGLAGAADVPWDCLPSVKSVAGSPAEEHLPCPTTSFTSTPSPG